MNRHDPNPPPPSPPGARRAARRFAPPPDGEGGGEGRCRPRSSLACDELSRVASSRLLPVLLLNLLALACAPKTPPSASAPPRGGESPAAQAPISNTDPCAMRLHDLCAPLLLYYATNQALPVRLDDLRQVPGFESQVELICPVSNRPYIYNSFGLPHPDRAERVVIYDPTPAHSGFRWAISIIEPQQPNAPLITKVIAIPESQFHLNLPAR